MPLGTEKTALYGASNSGNPPDTIELLVVGGGGAGQPSPGTWGGGGGGGGGFLSLIHI